MKHIKLFERRNFKHYTQYNNLITYNFNQYITTTQLKTYKENNTIKIQFKTWDNIDKKFINYILSEISNDIYYTISPQNSQQLTIIIENIPTSYLEKLDIILDAEKYNL